ncbi:non-ribosomal peptide synthetase, partial [Longispora fulva]
LLERVRRTDLDAYAHQDVPFERLVEALNPERSVQHHPLFQVVLAFGSGAASTLELPGLQGPAQVLQTEVAKFDLGLYLKESFAGEGTPDGISGVLEYATDIFDRSTVENLVARLVRVLEQVAADPELTVGAVETVTPAERHRVMTEFNDTAVPRPDDLCVHEAFDERAGRVPDAVAVLSDQGSLTYAELGTRANRLANHLVALGVRPEDVVAVAVERTPHLPVAVLGILKSGAAYAPVSGDFPGSRVREILDRVGATVIVTDHETLSGASLQGERARGTRIVVVDDDGVLADAPDTSPALGLDSGALAYVMFTSGSTGEPKGVAVTHQNVVDLARDECWHNGGHERVLVHSPLAFDASTYELWVPLLAGGTAVLAGAGSSDPSALARTIVEHGVTGAFLTAALFEVMSEQEPHALGALREVWAGGDVVSPRAVSRVLALGTDTTVVNGYGPTETTTFALRHPMTEAPVDGMVPIGRPLANTRAYVLDGWLGFVPVGVVGELYVAGAGVGRG